MIVNNAGYANVALVETAPEDDFGLTRVLATETVSFGIRYLVVEPSGFATDWAGSSMEIQAVPEEYRKTVGAFTGRARDARAADYFWT
ncbi:hypothetical protein [Streptomyces sp. NPDC059009]|uniref:hypothetical protein n=1 Tax=Streptomyces sp. NPDC059009 TaxID=3346694 RepID=UPI0036921541